MKARHGFDKSVIASDHRSPDDQLGTVSREQSSWLDAIPLNESPSRIRAQLVYFGIGGVLLVGIVLCAWLWSRGNSFWTQSAFKPVAFDIQGMKLGDRLTDEFAYNHCAAEDKGKSNVSGYGSIKVGGREVFVAYQFTDFKLISVTLLFDSDFFPELVQAYTSKFGSPPHRTRNEKLVTRVGVEYTNAIAEWETDSGVFQIMRYGSTVEKGFAILNSPQLLKYNEQERGREQKELKSNL